MHDPPWTWLAEWLPASFHPLAAWLLSPPVITVLVAASVVLFAASVVAVPWFIVRVPADHFTRSWQRGPWFQSLSAGQRAAVLVIKNVVGALLLFAGVAMLVLPGQGLITLVCGLILIDLPGKHRVERRLVRWPPLFNTLNRIRRRAGKEPLAAPVTEK